MSFTNAPVSRVIIIGLISVSIAATLLDIKHYFYILIDIHFWRYRQIWRFFAYQICYTNSTEVLFAAITLYNLRMIERLWGTRKYASFILVSYGLTSITIPLIMIVLRPLTAGLANYIPAGPTPLIFAVLAQFHAMVPQLYKYRIATSRPPPTNEPFSGLTLSDKSFKYGLALHLALLQWPGSVVGALVGWVVGYMYREAVLPATLVRWRVPGWLVGSTTQRSAGEFEGLRRRLEGESSATATGTEGQADAGEGRRRTMGQQVIDQFREVL